MKRAAAVFVLGTFLASACIMSSGCRAIQARQQKSFARAVKVPFEKVLPGPVTEYEVMQADSRPGHEYILSVSQLKPDGLRLEGKLGRSCAKDKPWLLIRSTKTGHGAGVLLAYSGNWRIEAHAKGEDTVLRVVTVPESLDSFETVNGVPVPSAIYAEFNGDWDSGAQAITRFIRARLVRNLGDDWPPVQYNTWYDGKDKMDTAHLIEVAKAAANVGCELFVIDAGWYGRQKEWQSGVGDWTVNAKRFPNGIEPVADQVRKLGMKFGMWVEIENANPETPVAKAHPEWFLRDGDKLAATDKYRMCLDFGNPEALAWAKGEIDRIVTTYRLDYIKMDFNTNLAVDSEKYAQQPDPLWRHYRGLAELWTYMRTRYPKLIVENCSSGSLRHDAFTAAHTDTHWVSDAVRSGDNLAMNFGATYLFPAETCSHWTCYPMPKDFMDTEASFTISMLGHMGLSGQILNWDEQTRRQAAGSISLYKRIRPILRRADVYHLTAQADQKNPRSVEAAQYLDATGDRSIVFLFQGGAPSLAETIRLRGLRPDTAYHIRMPVTLGPDRFAKGSELMDDGVRVYFPHQGASAILLVEPIALK